MVGGAAGAGAFVAITSMHNALQQSQRSSSDSYYSAMRGGQCDTCGGGGGSPSIDVDERGEYYTVYQVGSAREWKFYFNETGDDNMVEIEEDKQ